MVDRRSEEDAGVSIAPDLRHRLKSFIGICAQPDRSSWHYCPLTLKGNGGGILGHNFEDKSRESDEWQTISMVVRRIQLTWHQPGTRRHQATRQTTLYVPLSIFGCLGAVLRGGHCCKQLQTVSDVG